MKKLALLSTLAATLWLAATPAYAEQDATSPPDSSGRTVVKPPANMPGHGASSSEEDVELTQDIREKVAKDGSLSAMAHNISITSSNGFVTLRGPVTSESERQQVAALAERVAGSGKVNNQLEIAR